ncbi:MAG TPA: biopolymer transporter ExbD [Polyangiaceae bacterium]|nr:biopolymer transporter ExbD [Polyangiaceae bacterium]
MAITTGGRGGIKSDINVTPLVDVVLVLLIIFMVVTPMLQRGKSVELPRSRVVDEDPGTGDPVILSITSDRKLWYDHDEVTEEQLLRKLEDEIVANPNRPFLVKGDAKVTVGEVRKVMAIARKAGARGVRIAVEQLKEG